MLPEWVIEICVQKFKRSRDEVLQQIKDDDEHSFNANDSFDL